jgi:hypothetical protein
MLAVDAIYLAQGVRERTTLGDTKGKTEDHRPKLKVGMKAIMRAYINNEVEGQTNEPLIRDRGRAKVVAFIRVQVEGDAGTAARAKTIPRRRGWSLLENKIYSTHHHGARELIEHAADVTGIAINTNAANSTRGKHIKASAWQAPEGSRGLKCSMQVHIIRAIPGNRHEAEAKGASHTRVHTSKTVGGSGQNRAVLDVALVFREQEREIRWSAVHHVRTSTRPITSREGFAMEHM